MTRLSSKRTVTLNLLGAILKLLWSTLNSKTRKYYTAYRMRRHYNLKSIELFPRFSSGVYSKTLPINLWSILQKFKNAKTLLCVNVEEIKSIIKEQREDAENLMSRQYPEICLKRSC